MNFERRDFLRMGAAGIAGGVFASQSGLAQNYDEQNERTGTIAEFRGGTGSLHLKLKLDKAKPPGTLDLQLDNFRRGADYKHGGEKSLVMRGFFQPSLPNAKPISLHRSYFSADDAQIFVRLGDDHHWTSLVFSPTDDPNVVFVTVWNDNSPPDTFRVNKKKFNDERKPALRDYILDKRDKLPSLKGERNPPDISAEDLENLLDKDPDYLEFVRGKRYLYQHAAVVDFACAFTITMVPGAALFVVDWEG